MNQRAKRLKTTQKTLHPKDDRQYVSRKKKRVKRLANIEDGIDASIQELKDYKEKLITAVSNSIGNIRPNRKTTKTQIQKWEEKQVYEDFKWQTNEIAHEKTWTWQPKGNLKKET